MSDTMCPTPLVARAVAPARVLALHCSGSSGTQWRQLQRTLGSDYDLVAPDLLQLDGNNALRVGEGLSLEREAEWLIQRLDSSDAPVHILGHSYGGAVALRLALMQPERIASLALYEPSIFVLLREMGEYGRLAAQEIQLLSTRIGRLVHDGLCQAAAEEFVCYWGDQFAWTKLRPNQQQELTQQMPLVVQHFRALQESSMCLADLQHLPVPTLILRGGHSPTPARLISCHLLAHLPNAKGACFGEVGHMGPVTHADVVASRIAGFIDACAAHCRTKNAKTARSVAA